jgi:uncharacterized GH25 family protein
MKLPITEVIAIGALAALAGLHCARAQAHEFWIEPSSFAISHEKPVGVRLCVADGFEGWSLPRDARRIEEFVAAGPAGIQPIVGLDGSDPAGVARFTAAGLHVVTFRSNRAYTELPAAEFDEYVKEKGLEKIAARPTARRGNRQTVREAYSRHSKALIRVGDGGTGAPDRRMNLRLELVAEPDLFRAASDDLREFRLLHEAKPLAGALVTAARLGTADQDLKVRTDGDGRAAFRLRTPGMWRIAAVHLLEPPANVRADWESLWASLTFELPSQPSASEGAKRSPGAAACRNRLLPTTAQVRP